MTTSLLTLQGVAFTWPNGHQLFSGIDFRLDHRPTGLVGRNGAGKSVLARLTAGLLKPTRGHCRHAGSIHYVPQHAAWPPGTTVAAAAGVQTVLDALARIEAGQVEAADFEAVGGCWNIRQRLADGLEADGLGHLAPERSVAGLSGGELTRLALLGAWLGDPDILILDEPTNHLDRPQRMRLLQQLAAWQKGLLVISTTANCWKTCNAPWSCRQPGCATTAAALPSTRRRGRRSGNAPNRRWNTARPSSAAVRRHGAPGRKTWNELAQRVHEAARQLPKDTDVALLPPELAAAARRRVASLEAVRLPFGPAAARPIDLTLWGRQRIGVTGANDSGKSTLLKVLAGVTPAAAGRCERYVPTAFLDQQLDMLDPALPALEQLLAANPTATEASMRTRLALLGLARDAALKPCSQLSGGERLKVALACVIYAQTPAELLLLDEPTNHLDLHALEALEQTLRQFQGTLVLVSHDRHFLGRLALDRCIELSAGGCRVVLEERAVSP